MISGVEKSSDCSDVDIFVEHEAHFANRCQLCSRRLDVLFSQARECLKDLRNTSPRLEIVTDNIDGHTRTSKDRFRGLHLSTLLNPATIRCAACQPLSHSNPDLIQINDVRHDTLERVTRVVP